MLDIENSDQGGASSSFFTRPWSDAEEASVCLPMSPQSPVGLDGELGEKPLADNSPAAVVSEQLRRTVYHELGHAILKYHDHSLNYPCSPFYCQITVKPGCGFRGKTTYFPDDEIDRDVEHFEWLINRPATRRNTERVEENCALYAENRITADLLASLSDAERRQRRGQMVQEADSRLVVLMAGHAAEVLYSPIGRMPIETRSDWRKAFAYARTICASDLSAKARVSWAFDEALSLLIGYRPAVLALADILLERLTLLDGTEIASIIVNAMTADITEQHQRRDQMLALTERASRSASMFQPLPR